jgi:RNA polymerase sigma-70 factor (ECF subfamily)
MIHGPLDAPDPAVAGDAALVERAARGDALAFESILRRHDRLLFRTARSILRNDDDAEDVLQDAYLRAWRAMAGFRAEAKISTWLVRIVVNEALTRLRRRGAAVVTVDAPVAPDGSRDDLDTARDPELEPERLAMRGESLRLIERRIDSLPEVFRTVFLLRAVEELNVEETAAALGICEATVRTRFHRARRLLRERLSMPPEVFARGAFSRLLPV